MKRSILPPAAALVVVVMGWAAVGAASPGPPGSGPRMISNPDWLDKPNGEDLGDVYPIAARVFGVTGRVVIDCRVGAEGDLQGCGVVSESPAGQGFAEAALNLTPKFKMRPRRVDGVAVGGAGVRIPIRFQTPEDVTFSQLAAGASVDPPPGAMAVAQHIVAVSGERSSLPPAARSLTRNFNLLAHSPARNDAEGRAAQAGMAAFEQVLQARRTAFAEARASALARTLTPEELSAVADFLETPAGRAWSRKADAVDALEESDTAALFQEAMTAAHDAYCRDMVCPLSAPPPP